jgi:hypothetical protein
MKGGLAGGGELLDECLQDLDNDTSNEQDISHIENMSYLTRGQPRDYYDRLGGSLKIHFVENLSRRLRQEIPIHPTYLPL